MFFKLKTITLLLIGTAAVATAARAAEPIQPIKPVQSINLAQVELGKKLYFDPRLSKSGFISCNSCHNLSMGGTDNLKTSIGDHWQQGPINAPTVLNSSLNVAQFWDGRAADLKAQAGGPIANPGEMGFTHQLAVSVLASIPEYVVEFKQVFGDDSIDIDKVTVAIAEFEKTLVTPNSRFDRWLLGDKDALTPNELAGYDLFKNSGCIACHNGRALGGQSFQKMGAVQDYFALRGGEVTEADLGRFNFTHEEGDRHFFKVPTLRNVAQTAPYFHDGSQAELAGAVRIMGQVQLGRELTDAQVEDIVAFLRALDGELPAHARMPATAAEAPAAE